jgi:hypothetical protein
MSKKSIVIAGSMLALSLLIAAPALAAAPKHAKLAVKTSPSSTKSVHSSIKGPKMVAPRQNVSFGTVDAINGSSFTITSKKIGKAGTTTTLLPVTITVNTTSSTVFKKDSATAALSDLAVGQMVSISGVKDANNTIANAINVNINTHPMTWPQGAKREPSKTSKK